VRVALSHTKSFDQPSWTNKRKKFVPMSFIPKLTSRLGEVLKSVNMNPVFYPYIKIGRLFPNGKDSTPPLAKSDVVFTKL